MPWPRVQIAEKFLERDELASMSFQNDFLTPFVVVMRQSGAKEIRELIIRQASRMVLSRVTNIKSGWKSMFMVRRPMAQLHRVGGLHTAPGTSALFPPASCSERAPVQHLCLCAAVSRSSTQYQGLMQLSAACLQRVCVARAAHVAFVVGMSALARHQGSQHGCTLSLQTSASSIAPLQVFSQAAKDNESTIVRLSFETVEKIVREHFTVITETDVGVFADCVNCLTCFTNQSHDDNVALNAIAFLRFCAMRLAEGSIGDVDNLPEEVRTTLSNPPCEICAGWCHWRTAATQRNCLAPPGFQAACERTDHMLTCTRLRSWWRVAGPS